MSDWNLFVREARAGNFRGTRRSLWRGAGSKRCRQGSGRRIDFKKIHGLVGHGVAEERVGWRSRERLSTAYFW